MTSANWDTTDTDLELSDKNSKMPRICSPHLIYNLQIEKRQFNSQSEFSKILSSLLLFLRRES